MIPDQINTTHIGEILEELVAREDGNITQVLERLLNELALIEREKHLQATPYQRCETRTGHANGFKDKVFHTRSGPLNLKVPQVRDCDFYPSCLEKGSRSEVALKLAIAEMYVQGVSTRRVKKVAQELCGLEVSSTQVSRVSKLLDEELERFRSRELGRFKFLYLDAHYEKVRYGGTVVDLAVLKAVGVGFDGRREILGVSANLSEAEVHWRSFLENLTQRGMTGIELVISDDHSGLKAARKAVFPSVPWQRCTFHMAQNAQAYVPKRSMREEIAQAVRDIFNSTSRELAIRSMEDTVKHFSETAPDFCRWLERSIEEGLTFMQFPRSYWRKIRTVNMVERLNGEIRRRTRVARLFPNSESCLRLVTAVMQEQHEEWQAGRLYMKIEEQEEV